MSGPFRFWKYQDPTGKLAFQHYRVTDPAEPRGKRYGYRYLCDGFSGWVWCKPPKADELVYRLPHLLANRHRTLWSTEGERDADALLRRGLLATCHHGGAGKFTQAQALWLAEQRAPICLVADNDGAGAYDVTRRFDLLRDTGIPAGRLRVVEVAPTHAGADLRDHFSAGFGFSDLRRGDLGLLREVAATADLGADGYLSATAQEVADIGAWQPVSEHRAKGRAR